MSPRNKNVKLLGLISAAGLGAALAAALFNPDLVNSTTYATQPVGWAGSPVGSGYALDGTQKLFVIDYSSQDWSGNLHSYDIDATGHVSTLDNWDGGAQAQIKDQAAGTGPARKIVTMNGANKIVFQWPNLSDQQKTDLDPATATTESTSPVLDYIRGSKANEAPDGNNYRARNTPLGDIIHSTPRYWNDGVNETVYVGANDGMLHAINAADGTERFAYIPSVLIPKLKLLLASPYSHKYFVDGQLAARKFGNQSILVGGLGGGGKGLFGLDITTVPTDEADAANKILWEITNATANFTDLGHTYGRPVLTRLPNGTNVALVANGYNNTGSGHAVLYLINPATGAYIGKIDTGSGTTASPNGLSSPTVVDSNGDGRADYAYAGDIDGNLWKFDLAASSAAPLFTTTSPAQAITMAPGVKGHPLGGYMVTFVTGRLFEASDETNNATHYAYGIWDLNSATVLDANLVEQTLTETNYTGWTSNVRVRTATNNQPNYAGSDRGWKAALPKPGERVVADGAYITGNSTFMFLSTNPTINPNATPPFENWWMQLNYLTGGDNGAVRFDLDRNNVFNDADKVGGVSPVGRHMGGGVRSQLVEFSTPNYEIYIANYDVNGDPPVTTTTELGVAGGHFDYDSYYGAIAGGAQATATITVGTGGQTNPFPATLGAITIGGVVVVPALSVLDIVNGTATTTNATTIKNKVGGGFTATQSGAVITLKAPVGADYNGLTIDIAPGTEQLPLVASPGVAPSPGQIIITTVDKNEDIQIKCGSSFVGSTDKFKSLDDPDAWDRLDALFTRINGTTFNGYGVSCSKTVTSGRTTGLTCNVSAPIGPSACTGGFAIDNDIHTSTNTGPQGGVSVGTPVSGFTNFKLALTTTTFSGGADPTVGAITCCKSKEHVHEYDDIYDRTGVNMLDPSVFEFNLSKPIPSKSTRFKIIASNQYLSPAVKIHLNGTPAYQFNVDAGYTSIKDFVTSSTLDVSALPTYSRSATDTYDNGVKVASSLKSFAINMPVTAFSIANWWGADPPDNRAGLHPTQTGCVKDGEGSNDGNMYEPVLPPGTGRKLTEPAEPPELQYPSPFQSYNRDNIPAYGQLGYTGTTNQNTAQGVRHNGALTLQVIRADTPLDALEMSIPGRPEYGWRVKANQYAQKVLVEYTIFWHHPNKKCFGDVGWVKDPLPDNSGLKTISAANQAIAQAHSDPKIGALAPNGSGAVGGTVVTQNPDGSTTTVTTVINPDGSATVTTTISYPGGSEVTTVVEGAVNQVGGAVGDDGKIGEREITPGGAARRINWRELFK